MLTDVAAFGRGAAHHVHQLRDAAPFVLLSISRVLPHPLAGRYVDPGAETLADDHRCDACASRVTVREVTVHEWDSGRWFVVDDEFGMLGEIELAGERYRVLHTDDAKGAVFDFGSLHVATAYFEEYAEALASA